MSPKAINKRIVTLGEVMMRIATRSHERFIQARDYQVVFGGAEANVAVALANWGYSAVHVTAFPDNDLGKAALKYLRSSGIDTSFICFSEGRMGLYFLEKGAMQRSSKIIYDRFHSTFSLLDSSKVDWDAVFEGADWFHWTGITPAISASAALLCLDAIAVAREKGVKISGDINYRRNLWQYGKTPLDIMPELIKNSDVIIAGIPDFENCMDIREEDFSKACKRAQEKFPSIKRISTTCREAISSSHNTLEGVLWNGQELFHSKKYDLTNIVDRVGGGDAFMAGLIHGLLNCKDQEALEFAVASSVLKHSIPGDENYVSLDEVNQLVKGENVGKLLR
jgi:2-dehydro-3-deoxygluconokinase